MTERIQVIATTISGSVRDWSKVERILPLFAAHGMHDVELQTVGSHAAAREWAAALVTAGNRLLISAGGSGTFNAVLEGCCDSGVPLATIRLGFLRKGSADLIGKVLEMPDEVEAAIAVFAASIRGDHTVPCDVLEVTDGAGVASRRHFVGYGGAEIFGRVPHFTENRHMKWYKGVLSQVLGDLGPFTTGMTLAMLERLLAPPWRRRRHWRIICDGAAVAAERYQALIVVNGYLGPDLPYSSEPLGSGSFALFALRDLGAGKLLEQVRRARDGSIMRDAARWGMVGHTARQSLVLEAADAGCFAVNVDGSTMHCTGSVSFRIVDSIRLLARGPGEVSVAR